MADEPDVWTSWRSRPLLDELSPQTAPVDEAEPADEDVNDEPPDWTDTIGEVEPDAAPVWPLDGEGLDQAEMRLLRYRAADEWARKTVEPGEPEEETTPRRRRGDRLRRIRPDRERRGRAAAAVLSDADAASGDGETTEPVDAPGRSVAAVSASVADAAVRGASSSNQPEVEGRTETMSEHPVPPKAAAPPPPMPPQPAPPAPAASPARASSKGRRARAGSPPPAVPPLPASRSVEPGMPDIPPLFKVADAPAAFGADQPSAGGADEEIESVGPVIDEWLQDLLAPRPPAALPPAAEAASPAPAPVVAHVEPISDADAAVLDAADRRRRASADTPKPEAVDVATSAPVDDAPELLAAAPDTASVAPAAAAYAEPAPAPRDWHAADQRDDGADEDERDAVTMVRAGDTVIVLAPADATLAQRLELAAAAERLGAIVGATVEVVVETVAPPASESDDELPAGWTRVPAPGSDEDEGAGTDAGWTRVAPSPAASGHAAPRPGDHAGVGRQFERKPDEHGDRRRLKGARLPTT